MTIVDTSVWVDLLRGTETLQTVWLGSVLKQKKLGLTDLIFCEVLQGIDNESDLQATERSLFRFEIFTTGGTALAAASAGHYQFLRRRGRTIRRTIDCLIATFCITEGHSLLHHDRDFDAFEEHLGLKVIHPTRH